MNDEKKNVKVELRCEVVYSIESMLTKEEYLNLRKKLDLKEKEDSAQMIDVSPADLYWLMKSDVSFAEPEEKNSDLDYIESDWDEVLEEGVVDESL